MSNNLQVVPSGESNLQVRFVSVFDSNSNFEEAVKMCEFLSKSEMVPIEYRGVNKIPNTMIALDISRRLGESILTVMQNLDVIHGKPSFGSKYLIARARQSGYKIKYLIKKGEARKNVEHTVYKKGETPKTYTQTIDNMFCKAVMIEPNGEKTEGPEISIEMAVKEGWYGKSNSKWKNMPELMLRYRAASFLIKTSYPELAFGMPITEEVLDQVDTIDGEYIEVLEPSVDQAVNKVVAEVKAQTEKAPQKPKAKPKPKSKTSAATTTQAPPPPPTVENQVDVNPSESSSDQEGDDSDYVLMD